MEKPGIDLGHSSLVDIEFRRDAMLGYSLTEQVFDLTCHFRRNRG